MFSLDSKPTAGRRGWVEGGQPALTGPEARAGNVRAVWGVDGKLNRTPRSKTRCGIAASSFACLAYFSGGIAASSFACLAYFSGGITASSFACLTYFLDPITRHEMSFPPRTLGALFPYTV